MNLLFKIITCNTQSTYRSSASESCHSPSINQIIHANFQTICFALVTRKNVQTLIEVSSTFVCVSIEALRVEPLMNAIHT